MARRLAFDRPLFAAVILLLGLGLVMVYSTTAVLARERGYGSNPYFLRQCLAALVGLGAMVGLMHVDHRRLKRPPVVYALLGGVLALLAAALFAPELNNARRWFFVAGFSVQPSELAKLALVLFVASQIDRKEERLDSYAFLVPTVVATAAVAAFIYVGRDLGTTAVVVLPTLAMAVLAGIPWRYLAIGGLVMLPLASVAVLLESYRVERFVAFFDPERDPLGSGFQALQSLIAVGSGGLWGLGPGASVQKLYFLPSPHADFAFSILAEELGLVGTMTVVGLFGLLLWRGLRAAEAAPDTFGRALAWGLTLLLVLQALIHVSVALALLPTTGIPMPFISHGGSSLVVSLAASGLILNVSQHG